jgi:hypothetical protein
LIVIRRAIVALTQSWCSWGSGGVDEANRIALVLECMDGQIMRRLGVIRSDLFASLEHGVI